MIWLRTKAKMTASLLVLCSAATCWAQGQSTISEADSAGIKQTLSDWSAAYNRHDPHGCAQDFTEDAHMISLAGVSFEGRKTIEEHYGKTFSTTLANAHRTDSVKSSKFLSPDVVAIDDAYEITGSTAKTEGDHSVLPARHGILSLIYVKQNGRWLVAVSHEMEYPEKSQKP